jgi:ribosomal protein S6--L-glutamate ligase
VRVALLLQATRSDRRRSNVGRVTTEIVERLRERGHQVDLLIPDDGAFAPGDFVLDHDLYVLKAMTPLTMALAAAAAMAGAAIVNSLDASSLALDKVAATAVLATAGVPVPPSYVAGSTALLEPLLAAGPLWLKPQRGSQGFGVRRVVDSAELRLLHDATRDAFGLPLPLLAQREVPSVGRDLKVSVVGEQMWAITRPFPARTVTDKLGTPVRVEARVRAAAAACGRALGLDLYSVDFLMTADEFFVVDVSAFPTYSGVAEAPLAIAEHLHARALPGLDGSVSSPADV